MHPNQFSQTLLTVMDRSDARLARIEAMFERVLQANGLEIPAVEIPAEVEVPPSIGFFDRGDPGPSPSPSPEGDPSR